MTTQTISSYTSITSPIDLLSAAETLEITAQGTVVDSAFAAVYGAPSAASVGVINAGTILDTDDAGGSGIALFGTLGSVNNSGVISVSDGATSRASAYGIRAGYGISITNAAHATISSGANFLYGEAVRLNYEKPSQTDALTNAGTIEALGRAGIGVDIPGGAGGIVVTNEAGGVIKGGPASYHISGKPNKYGQAIYIKSGAATITNAGTISGYQGIIIAGTNSAAQTITNAGTIGGPYTFEPAISFGGGNADLILDPGAKFIGYVSASTTTQNTLDLASGASAGTISGVIGGSSAEYRNFATLTEATGADWTLGSTVAASENLILGASGTLGLADAPAFAGTIDHLVGGDTLVLTNDTYSASDRVTLASGNVLNVTNGATTLASLQLNPASNFSSANFSLAALGTGTEITNAIPCFVRGTRIRTTRGEVRVEALRRGDEVITLDGSRRPIRWIGRRRIDLTRHPRPELAQPVRILAGAFAPGLPGRDLHVSPGHSIYLDGALIAAEYLVNGATILREQVNAVEYFHVELDQHAVLFSEGLPSESYLDTGNRDGFENGGEVATLHPDFSPRHWSETCVPLIQSGPLVVAAREKLLARIGDLGFARITDPDLHIMAGGQCIEPIAIERAGSIISYSFVLPKAPLLALCSRSSVPAEIFADSGDPRCLGVAVHRLRQRHREGIAEIALDDAALRAGWHPIEQAGTATWRWTTGEATLALAGPGLLEVSLWSGDFFYYAAAPPLAAAEALA